MIITLRNIGSIKHASIDLDKDLIIFIGPNNTGKTYASYCLFGIDKCIYKFSKDFIDTIIDIDFTPLFENGNFEINLEDFFTTEKIKSITNTTEQQYKEFLPGLFAIEKSFFENSEVEFSYGDVEKFKEYIKNYTFKFSGIGTSNITVRFQKKDSILSLSTTSTDTNISTEESIEAYDRISLLLKENILEGLFYHLEGRRTFFLPAERIGISIFSKDLLRARFEKTNTILRDAKSSEDTESNEVFKLLNSELNTYSLPIQNALTRYEQNITARDRNLFRADEKIALLADELEEKLLKGKISVSESGDVYFNASLKIHIAGSMIKSLTSLVFYLRYNAYPGQILIIDEPEINLHPDNQRIIARVLAKLSKLGVKVVVSTHSDYFIREINNLIMLNKKHDEVNNLKEKYHYSDSEILDYKNIGAYLFRENKASELIVNETGMEAATIDEEINKLNNVANDIYWTLFED